MIWHLSKRALIRVKMLYPIDEIAMENIQHVIKHTYKFWFSWNVSKQVSGQSKIVY